MYDNIIFMKYGVHATVEVEEILKQKRENLKEFGYFLWGYGGSACHPSKQIKPFAIGADSEVSLVMSYTPSKNTSKPTPQRESSLDGNDWGVLNEGLHIYGSKWAIVCDSLTECDFKLQPTEYEVAVGPNEGKRLDHYVKGQNDKACARRRRLIPPDEAPIASPCHIKIVCSIAPPYAVFVR